MKRWVRGRAVPAMVLDSRVLQELDDTPSDDRPGLRTRVIRLFIEGVPEQIGAMSDATRESRAKDVRATAHSLKSSARHVGATALAKLCERMEETVTRGDMTGARVILMDLELAARHVIDALRRLERASRIPTV